MKLTSVTYQFNREKDGLFHTPSLAIGQRFGRNDLRFSCDDSGFYDPESIPWPDDGLVMFYNPANGEYDDEALGLSAGLERMLDASKSEEKDEPFFLLYAHAIQAAQGELAGVILTFYFYV